MQQLTGVKRRCLNAELCDRGDWFGSVQVTAIGSRVQAHEEGIRETDCRRETEERYNENNDLLKGERLNTYEDHADGSSSTGRAKRGQRNWSAI